MRAGVADRFALGLQDRGSEWSSRLPSSPQSPNSYLDTEVRIRKAGTAGERHLAV